VIHVRRCTQSEPDRWFHTERNVEAVAADQDVIGSVLVSPALLLSTFIHFSTALGARRSV